MPSVLCGRTAPLKHETLAHESQGFFRAGNPLFSIAGLRTAGILPALVAAASHDTHINKIEPKDIIQVTRRSEGFVNSRGIPPYVA